MLSCFTPEHPVRGIADMAEALNLGRSTTHRYATTLVTLGYLEQGPSRKYRLAARVSDFGLALLDSLAIRSVAREHLRELRAQTGRTVGLAMLDGAEVTYIDRWQGSRRGQYAIDLGVGVGTRLPAHCSAAGKALLACLPAAEQRELVAGLHLTKRAPGSITTKTALRVELERIGETDGALAVEDEELLAGRRAIAAPIFDGDVNAVAAIELAAPTDAFTLEQLSERIGPQLLGAARRATADLTREPVTT